MNSRVAYLDKGKVTIKAVPLPELKPNQVLVKTYQASVCGSERYYYRGISVRPQDEARVSHGKHEYPIGPLGHEGGGTIVEIGSAVEEYLGGGKVSIGDRVGSLGFPTYTDYWVADTSQVQPIPEGVSFEVGCLYEPLGCVVWAAKYMGVKLGDTVAVNGAGFSGNILLQGAIKSGASKVIAVDVVKSKLEIARELGAFMTIDVNAEDPVQKVLEITDGEGVDVAVEAVGGTGIGLKQALDMVRHNGIIAMYGDNYKSVDDFCFHRFHEDGLEIRTLSGVHYTHLRSIENMREAYRLIQRGVFNIDIILKNSAGYELDELPEVFEKEAAAMDTQTSLKTIITP